jgi:ATP-dependent Clp protease adaptor protein ClpS
MIDIHHMAHATSPPPGSKPPEVEHDREEEAIVKERPKTSIPRRYRVIFHNDDYTTMEFVVMVLMQYFHKTETEAFHIMMTVHKKGSANAGLYPRDVAETKVNQVMQLARENGMPLLLTAEPE